MIWENSDKVKEKDLAHLRKLLAEAGYIALWDKVGAKLYSCQSRPRIYLIAFLSTSMKAAAVDGPISEENLDAAVSRSWLPEVFRTLASLGGPSPPLDDYLLPDDHEEVREWTAHRMAVKTEADNKNKSHAELFRPELRVPAFGVLQHGGLYLASHSGNVGGSWPCRQVGPLASQESRDSVLPHHVQEVQGVRL